MMNFFLMICLVAQLGSTHDRGQAREEPLILGQGFPLDYVYLRAVLGGPKGLSTLDTVLVRASIVTEEAIKGGWIPRGSTLISPVVEFSERLGSRTVLFETPDGVYEAGQSVRSRPILLLPREQHLGQRWSNWPGSVREITRTDTVVVNNKVYRLVEVTESTTFQGGGRVGWAIGLGIVYSIGLDQNGDLRSAGSGEWLAFFRKHRL